MTKITSDYRSLVSTLSRRTERPFPSKADFCLHASENSSVNNSEIVSKKKNAFCWIQQIRSIVPPVAFKCIGRGPVLQTSILKGQTAPKLRLKKANESSKSGCSRIVTFSIPYIWRRWRVGYLQSIHVDFYYNFILTTTIRFHLESFFLNLFLPK